MRRDVSSLGFASLVLVCAACANQPSTGSVHAAAEAGAPPAPVYARSRSDAVTGNLPAIVVAGTAEDCTPLAPCHVPEQNQPNRVVDSYRSDVYERPVGRGTSAATYYPAIDIISADFGVSSAWVFYRLNLFGPESGQLPGAPGSLPHFYSIEVNFDADPAGDAIIELVSPSSTLGNDWSTAGLVVRSDTNDSLGGARRLVADGPAAAGNGYETTVFDAGVNTAPGAEGGTTAVQARVRDSSIEIAVFRPFLESLTSDAVTGAAFRPSAARAPIDAAHLAIHDDRSRNTLGSPYPWLETAGAPSFCPNGPNGDDALTGAQLVSLESGTRLDTGIVNPCYGLAGGIYEFDSAGTAASLADKDDVTFDVDLRITMTDAPDPVVAGSQLTYTLTVENATAPPGQASNVIVVDTLPASVTFASASPGCTHVASVATCVIGTLANGTSTAVQIVVTPNTPGAITNSAVVTSDADDVDPANNAASEPTTVLAICGNGVVEIGEACDDGNQAPADGCEADCKLSNGEPCTGDAACASGVCTGTCQPADACGNGVVEGSEACDDGNTVDGDGCTSTCLREDGRPCTSATQCASGVCDVTCGGPDTDLDGVLDIHDLDDDNDGLLDTVEGLGDSDGDGVRDAVDLDSDNDGIADAYEAGHGRLASTNGQVLCPEGVGANGFCDGLETGLDSGIPTTTALANHDGDVTPDYLDLDSDNDGLSDLVEGGSGCADANDDGVCDDPNGFAGHVPTDTDGDLTIDANDLDSDNDGLWDVEESAHAELDRTRDGVIDAVTDGDGDGIRDPIDDSPLFGGLRDARVNSDDDPIPDFQDPDGDGDGIAAADNCPRAFNPDQADRDGDGIGDACDDTDDRWGVAGGGCSSGGGAASFAFACALLAVLVPRRRAALIALALALPATSRAQVVDAEVGVERFQLASDADGILDIEGARVRAALGLDVALWAGYVNDPLTLYRFGADGRERAGSLVKNQVDGELVASFGILGRLQAGLALPLIFSQTDDVELGLPSGPGSSFAVGDLRLLLKGQLLAQARHGVDVALLAAVTVPTHSGDGFAGDTWLTAAPTLAISRSFAAGFRAGANLGYRAREQREMTGLEIDDEVFGALGAGYTLPRTQLELALAFAYATPANDPFGAFNRNYAELKPGMTWDFEGPLAAFLVTGFGVAEGYGTPDWRVLGGVRFDSTAPAPPPAPRDRDRDGLVDAADRCPNDPEDFDGLEDGDGCPDLDDDTDGIPDTQDRCPREPEDHDAFEDSDGCPDLDNDHDKIPDAEDRCPTVPEDPDGFEDLDGCPEVDNDRDGVLDGDDGCPLLAGSATNKGCPMVDRDGDTVADDVDNCPDWPGKPEFLGCNGPQLVKITATKLELLDTVTFASGRAAIDRRSLKLLDAAALVLKNHREVAVEIQGHTDDRGGDGMNLELSQARAAAVQAYFVKKGVAADRMTAKGLGESQPLAENTTAEGRARNRRVEIVIVKRVEATVPATRP